MERSAETQYPILDVLKKRWSPYSYTDRPVEPQKLRCLFEAARWSASSFNEQPWRFIVASKQDPDDAFDKALACLVEANQAWAKHVPVLLLCVVKDTFTRNDKPNKVAQHDLGLAMGNLTTQATSLGLHVHQMGGIDPGKVIQTYSVPDGFTPLTAAAIGYQGDHADLDPDIKKRDQGQRSRKDFGEFVFGGSFGEASSLF